MCSRNNESDYHYREHIVQISIKEPCCGRLHTSSCIVCRISYSRSGANVAGGVEAVMTIVVEHWKCSARRSFVHVVVFGERTRCTGHTSRYNSPGTMWQRRVWDCVGSRCPNLPNTTEMVITRNTQHRAWSSKFSSLSSCTPRLRTVVDAVNVLSTTGKVQRPKAASDHLLLVQAVNPVDPS